MQIHADILILATIAVLIGIRLFTVLGRRNEDEPRKPNPFAPPPEMPGRSASAENEGEDASFTEPNRDGVPQASAAPTPFRVRPAAGSLAAGLADVAALDASFDEKAFLRTARDAFTAVVEAYAEGALDRVSALLAPPLLAQFRRAAELRHAEGQSAQTRVLKIKEAEVTAARADGGKALLTVHFVSDQEIVLRDKSGAVIGGAEGRAEEVADTWVFARDTGAPDGPWVVIETRV